MQKPVAERTTECVTRSKPAHHIDGHSGDTDAFGRGREQNTIGTQFDDGKTHAGREKRVGRRIGFIRPNGNGTFFAIADNDGRERNCALRHRPSIRGARPQRRSVVQVKDGVIVARPQRHPFKACVCRRTLSE